MRVMNAHSARSRALLLEFGRVARVSELNDVLRAATTLRPQAPSHFLG